MARSADNFRAFGFNRKRKNNISELGRGDTVLFEAEQVTSDGLNYDSNLTSAKKNNGRQSGKNK